MKTLAERARSAKLESSLDRITYRSVRSAICIMAICFMASVPDDVSQHIFPDGSMDIRCIDDAVPWHGASKTEGTLAVAPVQAAEKRQKSVMHAKHKKNQAIPANVVCNVGGNSFAWG